MARFTYPAGGGGGSASVDIADFIFTNNEPENNSSSITLPGDKQMEISAGVDSDLYLNAGDDLYLTTTGDDIHIRAGDDVRFTANYNTEMGQEYYWRMDSEAKFQLPGNGYIENPIESSGDGYGNDTLKLVPDQDLEGNHQYLVIDPTVPNHLHIRAGGPQDYSSAELILGGERAGVHVSDGSGYVSIQSKKQDLSWTYQNVNTEQSTTYIVDTELAEPDVGDYTVIGGTKYLIDSRNVVGLQTLYTASGLIFEPSWYYTFYRDIGNHYWYFDNEGYLNGPGEGTLLIRSLEREDGDDLNIFSDAAIMLSGSDGEFLNDASVPTNQIATIGDVDAAVGATLYHGSFYDIQDQTASAGSIQAMRLRQTDLSNGVSIAGVNSTQITIANAGVYNIAFSAQLHQTNSSGITNIWLNKNGTPMENTNTKVAITSNNPYYVAAWNLFVDADAADYFELMWSSDSNNTVIEHEPATGSGPTLHPAVPSVIVTVNKVA
jgi:hypothetical protein